MSSNILPVAAAEPQVAEEGKNPFLVALGDRVRALRARRGMTRKAVATAAEISERHLANLEYGLGNASILVLLQVSGALQCPLAELIGNDVPGTAAARRSPRVALIGLRGAGKSTLGALLADDLAFPFVELSREIEKFAGCSMSEIQALYGMSAYRRYERRALEEAVQVYPEAVIATPGGLVSDPATFSLLLAECTTVWLQAAPEDHMQRVRAQGDLRPMAASKEAMEDLKGILAGRAAFYSKADFRLDTSAQPLDATFEGLRRTVREALRLDV
ncbi:MAG: helix-turn-helix transcriptional regulator [Chitinophagaceae bacterium]|nr:helix-turn-helix transcriptional regulator [Rubrivivax sp.]